MKVTERRTMERYTIAITNAQGFEFVTGGWRVGDFNVGRFVVAAVEAMESSVNGSARVTLFDGYTTSGDIVAQWYPKTRRPRLLRIEAECVADEVRDALAELCR